MNSKIIDAKELRAISQRMRAAGKKLVATNGCFDLLHAGHVRYLRAARRLGDALVVGVNGDDSVCELKGPGRPLNRELDRAEVIAALADVDYVTIFPEARATDFLLTAEPAIYVKGGDYQPDTLNAEESAALKKIKAEIRIVPFETGYSTSGLLQKLRETSAV
jgi:rfaE bifunctional protein nucleotidyltransferase chain/domain